MRLILSRMIRHRFTTAVPGALLVAVSVLCGSAAVAAVAPDLAALVGQIEAFPATRGQGTESARLARLFDLYRDARMRELPDEATYYGYVGVDDRLPDLSSEGLALVHRLSHLELAALDSIDRAGLSPSERLNAEILRRRLALEIEGERFHSFDPWHHDYLLVDSMNDQIIGVLDLLTTMPARTVADYERMLARLRAFPAFAEQGMARLREGVRLGITPPRVTLRKVPDGVLALLADEPLKSPLLVPFTAMPATIPAAEQQRLRGGAVDLFVHQVEPELRKLHEYLAQSYVPAARETTAIRDLPDGVAWYAWLLRYNTTTDLTPEQIHELGLAEVKRIRAEMDSLIASIGFHGDFAAFSEHLRTDPRFFYEKPADVLAGYRDITKRIDPELIRLFSHLPRLPYGVKEMQGGDTATQPPALYSGSSLAAGRPGWMLVNTYDLRSRPKWGMECLAAHEAVPGHHLQIALAEELVDLPQWRREAVYPAYSEGWGLYAESLGAELGLYKDPYSKFGQLNNEIWRAIRLVVDTGLQTKGWTRQQAIDYCRANSAKTTLEIENEIDRYIVQPGSVPAYKIGELEIRRLRRYAEAELGPRFDVRAFHDRVLGGGALPLDLLGKSVHEWVAELKGASADRRAKSSPASRYQLQSRFWLGLHQTLTEAAQRGAVPNPGADAHERQLWESAVAVYRQRFGNRNPVFDDELVAINDSLSGVEDLAQPPAGLGAVGDALQQVADVYRRRQWPADELASRFWMAVAGAMIDQAGEELVAAHERVYGVTYPAHVTVDVSPYGGEFGAYTTSRHGFVHTTVSTHDPAYQGYWGLEMMLHEASHAVVGDSSGAVGPEIAAAARALDRRPPPGLWHAVLFYTSGDLTRRALLRRGIDYRPFIEEMYKRTFKSFREPLATHWQGYLDGKLSRAEAIRRLVEATTKPAPAPAAR